jgi:uncharacterized protein (DUF1778 family)
MRTKGALPNENRRVRPKICAVMKQKKKNNQKPKLNVTVHEEQRRKLEQMASIEKRSVSNLIEVMADERWERLVGQQGVAYAKTVAEAMNLKVDMDNPRDREKLRRAVLELVAKRKIRKPTKA